jgi:ubiquitin-protein ligase E3 C
MMRTYEGDVEDLMLSFAITDENEVTGARTEVELLPNGAALPVTNKNKFRYIYMVADFRLNRRLRRQTEAFMLGFHEVIPLKWLSLFNERELQMLISGAAQYIGGFSSSDSRIKMFWSIVEKDLDEADQGRLLKFVTSCPRPPLMGFRHLHPPFTISLMDADRPNEKLPTASTCFNILRLPSYSNSKIMKEKLLYAINSNAGFELA